MVFEQNDFTTFLMRFQAINSRTARPVAATRKLARAESPGAYGENWRAHGWCCRLRRHTSERTPNMPVRTSEFTVSSDGYCHLHDITDEVRAALRESQLHDGIACVAVVGSTAAVSTVEYEPGLLEDIPQFFEKILPSDKPYRHDETWHDGNGFSHMRSFLLKTSHTVPFSGGKLLLGTWQQIVLVDFDNRKRRRSVVVQLVGE
jgi:secondary thiamine-phosphate synthase enzyme